MKAFSSYRNKSVGSVVKKGTGTVARNAGFSTVEEVDPWQETRIGNVKITTAPAKHGVPENTYVLEKNNQVVFFGGDTLLIPELSEVAKRFPKIDVAMLPVNGLQIRPMFNRKVVMNEQDAASLCAILRPRVAIPSHYAFTAGKPQDRRLLKHTGTPEGFKTAVEKIAPETRVEILSPGRSLA
jgi:L-ascorbate metabolism protein UlaG (beta-lactamase superfamily)